MPLGLQNAFGLENAQQGLRQRIIDQLNQQREKQQMNLAEREQALREQEAQQRAEQFKMTQADHAAALSERSNAANVSNAVKLAPDLPMDQNVSSQAGDIIDKGGMGGQLYAPPTMGENVNGTPFDAAKANPRMNLGTPVQQKDASDSATITAMVNDPKTPEALRGFLRVRSVLPKGENIPHQLITEPNGPQGTTTDANYMLNGKPIVAIRKNGRLTYQGNDVTDLVKPYVAPPTSNPGDKLVKVEHKDPATGRTVIEWLPQSEVKGKTFEKGASGATETRLNSAQAVTQTGEDIIKSLSNPDIAAQVGPALGRANSLREFIGNPPPEFAELAGQIESFALANMGVHGMRSVQGSEKIKALLDGHHTPESLAAGIRGLSGFSNHFLENEGRGKAKTGTGAPNETPDQRAARLRKAAGL